MQDFDDMKAYDVTGVGLNLGTADEFARKVRGEKHKTPARCGRTSSSADIPTRTVVCQLRLSAPQGGCPQVGTPFPPGRQQASDGIWVVGIIKARCCARIGASGRCY
jgi:hypothetical protein